MNPASRRSARSIPLAGMLSLALALPVVAEAQAAPSAPATPAAPAAKDLPLSAAERQPFVGTYLLSTPGSAGRSMPFRVYEQQGSLYGQPQGGQAMRLLYQGENRFRPEKEQESLLTFTLEAGKVTRFSVTTPQGTLEGVRESREGA
jgi:hypothetical protein